MYFVCRDGYNSSYDNDKHYGSSAYQILNGVEGMQLGILANGPIAASFIVYKDFTLYKSGIYEYYTGKFMGFHSVKVVGWGEFKNIPYWLVANSWGTEFGDHGFFKICRGNNECGFESYVTAGLTKADVCSMNK